MKFALAKKINMTQIFDNEGLVLPVTALKLENLTVTGVKGLEKDGYEAVQVGFGERKMKNIPKPQHFNGKGFQGRKEFKVNSSDYKVGDSVETSSVFEPGDVIQVSAISKGKGFQGVVKRYGFAGAPASHGTHKVERRGGSIGGGPLTRVIKGKKMPGRMGSDRVTVKNLNVVKVDPENNLIWIKGSIPGTKGSLVEIRTI